MCGKLLVDWMHACGGTWNECLCVALGMNAWVWHHACGLDAACVWHCTRTYKPSTPRVPHTRFVRRCVAAPPLVHAPAELLQRYKLEHASAPPAESPCTDVAGIASAVSAAQPPPSALPPSATATPSHQPANASSPLSSAAAVAASEEGVPLKRLRSSKTEYLQTFKEGLEGVRSRTNEQQQRLVRGTSGHNLAAPVSKGPGNDAQ